MTLDRRDFFKTSMGAAVGAGVAASGCATQPTQETGPFDDLAPMTDGVVPIEDERRERQGIRKRLTSVFSSAAGPKQTRTQQHHRGDHDDHDHQPSENRKR